MKKQILIYGGVFVGFLALIFILELFRLGMFKFFAPKKENIRREVFENTKSYTHGLVQDLSKYWNEYRKAESQDDKNAIKGIVRVRFAEFDIDKLNSPQLKQFLINMRGY